MGDISKIAETGNGSRVSFDDEAEGACERAREGDPLQKVVHIALAVYLLPALLLVLAIGGVLIVGSGVARAVAATAHTLAGLRLRPGGLRIGPVVAASVATGPPRRVNPPMAGRISRGTRTTPRTGGGRPGAERLN
jgi:hypothetical protein